MNTKENTLFHSIKSLIEASGERVFRMANSTLLMTYWQIGQLMVEDEQQGKQRAEYGKYTLKNLSKQLSLVPILRDGKGFDESNFRNFRTFYQSFPIRDTLRHELSWSHYRLLFRTESAEKLNYHLNETIESKYY